MANIRNPEFGIKKDRLTLNSQDPNAVMYGVTPDNKFIPIKVSNTGEIMLGGTIVLEPGDLQIGAVEIKNYDTDDRVFVSADHEMRVESRLHAGDGTDITATGSALDINIASGLVKDADDNSIAANQAGLQLGMNLLYGYDGSANWERLHQSANRLLVDGSEVTQPISALALPLPSGASTEATLLNIKNQTDKLTFTVNSLDVNITGGSSSGPTDTDDGSVAGAQLASLNIGLNYGWNGATWERVGSTSGALDVNIASGSSSGPTDTDDDSVAGGQSANLGIGLTYGYNGVTWERVLSTSGRLEVDGSNVTQPVSVSALPLPTGASTSALQTAGNLSLSNIDTAFDVNLSTVATQSTLASVDSTLSTQLDVLLSTRATEATLASLSAKFNSLGQKAMVGSVPVVLASDQSALPISVASLPLPLGASTSSLQTAGNLSLSNIDTAFDVNLSTVAKEATLSLIKAQTDKLTFTANSLDVNITGGVSSPTDTDDGSIAGAQTVGLNAGLNYGWDGATWERLLSTSGRLEVDGSNVTQPVSVSALPLPTGASTSALQTAGNLSLSNIDTSLDVALSTVATEATLLAMSAKIPALGQAVMASSQPVVLASDQTAIPISALALPLPSGASTEATLLNIKTQTDKLTFTTNSLDVNITGGSSSGPTDLEDGSVAAGQTASLGIDLPYGWNGSTWERIGSTSNALDVNIASGSSSGPTDTDDGGVAGSQTAALAIDLHYGWNGANWERINSTANKLEVDGSGVTQPVSALALPLPSGASTSALQLLGNASLSSIDSSIDVALSTVATEATLSTLDAKFSSLGQKAMVASTPVVLASDQSVLPISASALPLPTGASTSALQTAGNLSLSNIDTSLDVALSTVATEATLATIDSTLSTQLDVLLSTRATEATLLALSAKFNSLGQQAMVGSTPVVLASDQTDLGVTQSGTWDINDISGTISLPTGASTSALQTAGNLSLSNIDTSLDVALSTVATEATLAALSAKFGSLGQKAMVGSAPVVISSDQSTLPVNPYNGLGVAEHWNGNAVVTPATVTFSGTAQSILVENIGNASIQVSFDGGTKWKTILRSQSMSLDAAHSSIDIKSVAGSVGYEILAVV